ncbi:hypothetical protein cypCar_00042153 [Cyprinus carpio]|nr:hypothetical protein cypCar_00042153 [Cyprinus carpio]
MGASKSLESSGEVRIKHSLIKNEEEFVVKRKKAVLQCLKNLKISCSRDKVPHIALLGSGGGQRAMVGLLGSLVQLDKSGSLDCIFYLVSHLDPPEPDWSTKLDTVKNKIIERISGPGVSWGDAMAKLKNYYYGKDLFSLTDVWAVLVVTAFVKEVCKYS